MKCSKQNENRLTENKLVIGRGREVGGLGEKGEDEEVQIRNYKTVTGTQSTAQGIQLILL